MVEFQLWMLFVKKGPHGWVGMKWFAPRWARRGYEKYMADRNEGWK